MVGTPTRKKILDIVRGNRSYGKTFDDIMSGALKPVEEILKMLDEKDGRIERLTNELENRTISCPCVYCGEEVVVYANCPDVKVIREYLKKMGCSHPECRERAKS